MTQGESPQEGRATVSRHNLVTIMSISVVVYALSSFLHEGVGHGGACLLVGCKPQELSSMNFDGNADGLGIVAGKLIAAGGPIVSVAVGILGFSALRFMRIASLTRFYFIWLLATVNLMQGTGYFLFSGFSGMGDLAGVIDGWQPLWLWRVVLVLIGAVTYYVTVIIAMKALLPLLGSGPDRRKKALVLTLVPFITGSIVSLIAGSLNPAGVQLVLTSGLPATLGGTSGLIWGPQLLNIPALQTSPVDKGTLPKSVGWIVGAIIVGLAFIFVLGPALLRI